MAPICPQPPIKPHSQGQDDIPGSEQTLYTISEQDRERLKPYLPAKPSEFLLGGPSSELINSTPKMSRQSRPPNFPHVTLTYAQSLDSQISLRPGQRTVLSGLETKAMTHFLRANHNAILIGAGTANADNPGLNSGFSYDVEEAVGLAQQPRPLVLDPGRSWKVERCGKMFGLARRGVGRAPWWIIGEDRLRKQEGGPASGERSQAQRDEERIQKIRDVGGDVIEVGKYGNREDGVEWEKILQALWDTGIRSIMIEGGATVINDLLRARNQHLVTSVIVTIAPTYLGSGGVVVAPPRSVQDENEVTLRDVTWIPFGLDVVMAGRLIRRS